MPSDSQAITRMQQDRLDAIERLERVTNLLADAQSAVDRYTTSKTTIEDEIADLDAAIAATLALP